MGTFGFGRVFRAGVAGTALIGAMSFAALPLMALADIVIPIDQVVRGKAGEVHLLVEVAVGDELVGVSCPVLAVSHNQESMHPDSDLIIKSGDSEVIVEDVESEPFVVVVADGELTLADTVSVSVRLGPDGVFSGGLDVTIACGSTTTTTEVSGTSVTNGPSTTEGTTSTTADTEPSTTEQEPTSSTGDVVGTSLSTTTETVGGIVVTNPSNPQISTTSSVPGTLPFTGISSTSVALLALVVLGIGGLALVATRSTEDQSAPWSWTS